MYKLGCEQSLTPMGMRTERPIWTNQRAKKAYFTILECAYTARMRWRNNRDDVPVAIKDVDETPFVIASQSGSGETDTRKVRFYRNTTHSIGLTLRDNGTQDECQSCGSAKVRGIWMGGIFWCGRAHLQIP